MAATLTPADLRALGRTVVNGVAVKIEQGLGLPPEKRVTSNRAPAPRSPYRSKWEAERAEYLERMKQAQQIKDWRYEPMRLRLAKGAWYKPDFLLVRLNGDIVLEEVKGFFREAAKVRYKVARELYPMFDFHLITKKDGRWHHAD